MHREVCHLVESVDLAGSSPGVAGRLRVVRSSEPGLTAVLGEVLPLSLGSFDDVPPR